MDAVVSFRMQSLYRYRSGTDSLLPTMTVGDVSGSSLPDVVGDSDQLEAATCSLVEC